MMTAVKTTSSQYTNMDSLRNKVVLITGTRQHHDIMSICVLLVLDSLLQVVTCCACLIHALDGP